MVELDTKIVIFVLVVSGLLLIYNVQNNTYVAFALWALAIYVWIAKPAEAFLKDRKERWVTAQTSFGGRNILPEWRYIKTYLDYRTYNGLALALYGYISTGGQHKCGKRHGVVIDKEGNIVDDYNPHVAKLAYGDWVRNTEEKAHNVREQKNFDVAKKTVEAHGFKVVPKGNKHAKTDDEDE